ncbi:MAG: hypothetical protein JO295_02680 [Verrucomicrobia bacterium]|nr:hypothetical protein [Verrucomicrobiota bacterium]
MPIFPPQKNGRFFPRRFFLLVAAAWWLAWPLRAQQVVAPLPEPPMPIRGMTISNPAGGDQEWTSAALAQTFDELKVLGVNTVALDTFAQVREDGHIDFSDPREPERISRPLDGARERGLAVMLIARLGFSGTRFSWRGEISFNTNEEWNRFFADYLRWIVATARLAQAHGAGLLCIGLEYTHAQVIEERWREIITAVRAVYGGKLTYGGSWDSYGQVGFYDALDYLGVLAYFPLTSKPDPSLKQIAQGWEKHLRNLRALSQKLHDKPVLFVQIGYNESARAASDPWSAPRGGPHAAEIQSRCVDAALHVMQREAARGGWLAGLFWWQWPLTNAPPATMAAPGGEDFDLRQPHLQKLVANFWRRPADAPAPAEIPASDAAASP